ncbi:FAD-dependent oxidoreductase [Aspergillus stella-maris]|uniref:FAD-dependent oxidoreductase n=1 Tax=Aspergillus stella-maris TaxID=1810926 RepID=UPI003CCC91DD
MAVTRKAIIIGAGPAGLSLALHLHQTTNIRCTIYELRTEPTTLGGAIGIPSNGLRLFDRLGGGIYQSLLARGSSRSDFAMHSLNGSILAQDKDVFAHSRSETGYGYMRVKRTDIVDVLHKAVKEADIAVLFNKRITSIEEGNGNVTAIFADGTKADADILFGCDGIHSAVRQLYVDQSQKPEYSGLAGLMSIIPTANLPESATKHIRGLTTTFTNQGMFMGAPCTASGDEVYWGFQREMTIPNANEDRDGWEVQGRHEIEGFKKNLHGVLAEGKGEWCETLRLLVDQTEVMKFYPIYRLPLGGCWSRGKVILIGDAAHAMQPHAGQGVGMALEDVFLVSRLLADASQSMEDVGTSFHTIRKPRVEQIYHTASHNAQARKNTGPWGQWIREWVIWASFANPFGAAPRGMLGQKFTTYDIEEEII